MKIEYGGKYACGTKAFQLMLEKLGGYQARYWTLQPAGGPKASQDRESANAGFRFIEEKGPRSNAHNEQTEW